MRNNELLFHHYIRFITQHRGTVKSMCEYKQLNKLLLWLEQTQCTINRIYGCIHQKINFEMASKSSNVIFQPKMDDVPQVEPANPTSTQPALIKCCVCGNPMQPTASNICVQCLAGRVDITEGITKQGLLHFCRQCGRYMAPHWTKCELESQELLSICLKKIKGLNRVKLIDAGFVWTEPHSRRIKLKITIQKEVQANTILQSSFVAELVVENMQCDDCKKVWTPHTWNSVVQLRQKVDHKRAIYYLEQIILKHNMHSKAINVKEMPDGIDFFFANKTHALILYDFLHSQVVSKFRQSKQLISADLSSNQYNYKHTYYVEVAPVCREDLVFIPPKLQKELGGSSPICLVSKMASMLQLLDPINQRTYSVDNEAYWSHEFKPICTRKQLAEFIVLNVEPIHSKHSHMSVNMSRVDEAANYCYADVELQRITDFGENDNRFYAKTHLGNVLKIDDHVLCYDLESLNVHEIEGLKKSLPDIIIVKKKHIKKRGGAKQKKRIWKLKHIEKEAMEDTKANKKLEERNEKDYEEFLEEIEEDPEFRSNINLFRVILLVIQKKTFRMKRSQRC
eukprot:TRINITY_DN2901_c4_g1_i1.p3 TRINITY_DN2901_c4_g1~~TRINITY_DN2901_c4_g1_i1.p3  ORF type:complete len:566 (+),score=39.86 TRINITY_DN2901_c4_g1_i1:9070-10767(+)